MFCKKCGTEQKEGQKFCPKCGTPYIDLEQEGVMSSNKDSILEIREKEEEPAEKEQIQEQTNESQINDTRPLNPDEEKKVVRISKAGMWIILIAIVFTFVRAGFGFSFWWYIYLLIMAFIAFIFLITSNSKVRESRRLDSNDSYVINLISWVGAIMLVILYIWGPLNSHSSNESGSEGSYSIETEQIPSWLTKWKFVCIVENGGKIVIRLYQNGTAHMMLTDPTGAPIKGSYNGEPITMDFNGTFTIEGNHVYLSFAGTSKKVVLEIDEENHRLYGEGGGVFKQSI